MTRTTPSRLTTLQLRHILLTEARTFIAYPFLRAIALSLSNWLSSTQNHIVKTSYDFEPVR